MFQFNKLLVIATGLLIVVNAQIPSFGRCPEFQAMPDFDKNKFMGTWHEIERYFTVTEVVSKCISALYEKRPDGKIYVNNYYTNRINNVQRIISGKFALTGKGGEGRFNVKYETFPLNYEASLVVLDTDYKNFAVIWSCSNIGPVGHTESAWVMARERVPPGNILQGAYGVLDKFKLSRNFFVKTEQTTCVTLPPPVEAIDPAVSTETKNTLNGTIPIEQNTVKAIKTVIQNVADKIVPQIVTENETTTKLSNIDDQTLLTD